MIFPLVSVAQTTLEFAVEGVSDSVTNDLSKDSTEAVIAAKLNAIEQAGVSIQAALDLGNFNLKHEWVERMAEATLLPGSQLVDFGYGGDSLYYVSLFGEVYTGDIISENLEGDKKYRLAKLSLDNNKVGALAQMEEVVMNFPHCSGADDALFALMNYGEFELRQERFATLKSEYPKSQLTDSAKVVMEIYDFQTETFDGMDFILLPPGILVTPDGLVKVESFYIQTTEMTQALWSKNAKNKSINKGDDKPVEYVSVKNIDKFLDKLNKDAGGTYYRLPTTEEWEYACRAGNRTAYYYGDDPVYLEDYAWFLDNSNHETHPVALKESNFAGLYDCLGNVWEWCRNDVGSKDFTTYICGGSWNSKADEATCSAKKEKNYNKKFADVGFRLVRIMDQKTN